MNASEFKKAFAELPPIEGDSTWDKHRLQLRKHVANDDINEFLRWSIIQATMFVGDAPYIKAEYDELPIEWYDAIQEPGFGKSLYIPWVKFKTSGNLIHQAYHLKQWVDKAGIQVNDLSHIVEVGGGYGAMALLCNRLGFKGLYTAFDLQEFLMLQEFYLRNVSQKEILWNAEVDFQGIGNLCFCCDLFIALFSLSEMPIEGREKYLAIKADNYLIAYQPRWNNVDNRDFFAKFVDERPNHQWWDYANPHFVNYRYLIGVKK